MVLEINVRNHKFYGALMYMSLQRFNKICGKRFFEVNTMHLTLKVFKTLN